MLSNKELVELYLPLFNKCMDYQFSGRDCTYKDDLKNDLILELLNYDNIKLNDAHEKKHMNAFLTRIIQNNIRSNTSWYYRRYVKWDRATDEITEKENQIPDA